MNSHSRVEHALKHREADRVPFDLGGTGLTTIHRTAYQNLRRYLDLPPAETRIMAMAEQLAVIGEDLAERLETDFRLVMPGTPAGFQYTFRDEGAYEGYTDEWGIGWRKPKDGGFYYDMYQHPLADADSWDDFRRYPFPDPVDNQRFIGLREHAEAAVCWNCRSLLLAAGLRGILY
jgi:uroporphyrinogen decarboxylase